MDNATKAEIVRRMGADMAESDALQAYYTNLVRQSTYTTPVDLSTRIRRANHAFVASVTMARAIDIVKNVFDNTSGGE